MTDNHNNLSARVMELETKVMFQDDLIEKLNHSLIEQQNDIKQLTKVLERLNTQLEDIQSPNIIDANLETPPPHY